MKKIIIQTATLAATTTMAFSAHAQTDVLLESLGTKANEKVAAEMIAELRTRAKVAMKVLRDNLPKDLAHLRPSLTPKTQQDIDDFIINATINRVGNNTYSSAPLIAYRDSQYGVYEARQALAYPSEINRTAKGLCLKVTVQNFIAGQPYTDAICSDNKAHVRALEKAMQARENLLQQSQPQPAAPTLKEFVLRSVTYRYG